MAYSNRFDPKLDLVDFPLIKSDVALLGERRFALNKSRRKFVSIGISPQYGYEPFIQLMRNKGGVDFHNYQGINKLPIYKRSDKLHQHCPFHIHI